MTDAPAASGLLDVRPLQATRGWALTAASSSGSEATFARVRRYERHALEPWLNRLLPRLHTLTWALTGSPERSLLITRQVLLSALADLQDFAGTEEAFEVHLLQQGAVAARADGVTSGDDWRRRMAALSQPAHELLALRALGRIPTDSLVASGWGGAARLQARLLSALRQMSGASGQTGPAWGMALDSFDRAVDAVVRDGDPGRAEANLAVPPDSAALLDTVVAIRRLAEAANGAELGGLRRELLAEAMNRRVQWVQRNQVAPQVPGAPTRRPRRLRAGNLALLSVVLMITLGGALFLALVSAFADPDSSLYPFKRLGESMLLVVPAGQASHIDLELKLAQLREREAEDMAASKHGDLALKAERDRLDLLRAAARDLANSPQRDARWRAERDQLLQSGTPGSGGLERQLQSSGLDKSAADARALDDAWLQELVGWRRTLGGPSQPSPSPSPAAAG
ncbi:MAG: DUF5667 domain-containing protein [Candidatus Dormibacter sp.]|uniref:DUF5667 domain-containing protein n=1 Tax=Candidatus Dormibacter sp. TaxID=2973982 RepID=UPI0026BEEF0C